MSKRRRSDADAAIADLLRRNPELPAINPHLAQPAPQPHAGHAPAYQLTEAAHPAPTEHEEQVALFEWAAANEGAHPELRLLFSVPNGGERHPAVAAKMKASGTKAGVPDCCLPVARGDEANGGKVFHGLFLELKKADHTNHATPAQNKWIELLRRYGYQALVCYGADEAIAAIQHYLNLDERNAV